MEEKDKQLVKDSALAIADSIVSNIHGLNFAWGLTKALFGAGLKLRQQRALEWVEMVRDNPDIFVKVILEQEEFQDGFVLSLEKYILERNKSKREYIKNIFIGFTQSDQKQKFELERLLNTISIISVDAIELLVYIDKNIIPEMNREYNLHDGQIVQRLSEKVQEHFKDQKKENHETSQLRDAVAELISLGIFRSWTVSYNTIGGGGSSVEYNISIFGNKFIEYIKE